MAEVPSSGVAVIASPTGASLDLGASDNPALGLARALGHLSDSAGPAVAAFAASKKKDAEAKARADALKASGTAFAEAVRTGKIEKTQNPWYIQQYEQQAAQVRFGAAASQLATDSAGWAERNDPQAFAKKWNESLGQLAQSATSTDQLQGFEAGTAPISQQVLASNTAYNVQRIKDEHVQNISTLTTKAILDAKTANGDHPTPQQVFDATEPQHKEWLATGGTEADWNMMLVNSVIAAGTNSADPTLLEVLKDERGGKGALANIAGPDGKPVAETISAAQHYIQQAADEKGMAEFRAHQAQVKTEGTRAEQDMWTEYGYDLINGTVPKDHMIAFLQTKGYSPEAAMFAIGDLAEQESKNMTLSRALMSGDEEVLQLYTEANTNGMSAQLKGQIGEMVRTHRIDLTEAEQIQSTAQSRTNHLESENRADARQAVSDRRANEREARQLTADHAKDLVNNRQQNLGSVSTTLQRLGDKSLLDPKTRTAVERGATDAEGAWLVAHPGDVAGAMTASDNYLNAYATQRINRIRARKGGQGGAPAANSASNGNPRR
jgi:hypothetical protein